MVFQDRLHAARKLAAHLLKFKGQRALVLAIPRGGVPMAQIIADEIDGDLDVVLVHKLGHPDNPEFAVGAIDEDGHIYIDNGLELDEISATRLSRIKSEQLARLKKLRTEYTPLKPRIDPGNRIVIIVDDGIATGWTAKAAIAYLRRAHAKRIVVAVPVGPANALDKFRKLADEVICLETPTDFQAVGQFYSDFSQITDEEVADIFRFLAKHPSI